MAAADDGITCQGLQGRIAQGHHQCRAHQVQLLPQPGHKESQFLPIGRSVGNGTLRADTAGPHLHHIADIDLRPLQADGGKELVQVLTGLAHEGTALLGLLSAWSLPDQHQPGLRSRALTEHQATVILREGRVKGI